MGFNSGFKGLIKGEKDIWAGFLPVYVRACDELDIQNLVDNKSEGVCSGGVHLFTKCILCNSASLGVLDMNVFQI